MCTALSLVTKDHYFGRNLDLEYSYNETVTVTPRNFPLKFRNNKTLNQHYAIIGMAYVYDDYPLYYEATNEKGLSMAGLNFPNYAHYMPEVAGKDNIAPFEFILWILGQCKNMSETLELLQNINLFQTDFRPDLPLTPLHWIISDRNISFVVESLKEGLQILPNPVGVLTNSPPFDKQLASLDDYRHSTDELPGDWSSRSRFIRASFLKANSICKTSEPESVSQFFHLLDAVKYPRGCVVAKKKGHMKTVYSCCCNTDKGIYYYKTYENSQISAIDMYNEDLERANLISYPLTKEPQINWQN